MKKINKTFVSLLVLSLALAITIIVVVCYLNRHNYQEEYTISNAAHWQACTDDNCDKKRNYSAHKYVKGVCSVCGYDINVSTAEQLVASLTSGKSARIIEDITVDSNTEGTDDRGSFTISQAVELDLNGHKLYSSVQNWANYHAILVDGDDASLTIKDTAQNGTFSSDGYGIFVINNAKVVVLSGYITTQSACITGVYQFGRANIVVKGGTLETVNGDAAICMPTQGNVNISGGEFIGGLYANMGQINISGGKFIAAQGNLEWIGSYFSMPRVTENINKPDTDNIYSHGIRFGNALSFYVGVLDFEDDGDNSLNVSVTGGEFINNNTTASTASGNEYAIDSVIKFYVSDLSSQSSSISINGGTFKSAYSNGTLCAREYLVDQRYTTNTMDSYDYQYKGYNTIKIDNPKGIKASIIEAE
jgi:hypothetical protein